MTRGVGAEECAYGPVCTESCRLYAPRDRSGLECRGVEYPLDPSEERVQGYENPCLLAYTFFFRLISGDEVTDIV